MKKANKRVLIFLLCFALLVTMFTACSTKSSTSKNTDLAKGFLTEFFTINSNARNAALMTNIRNNSDIFTDESAFNDGLKEYYSAVSKYLTDECLDKLIKERTMWKLDAAFLGARSSWEISALDIQNTPDDTDSYCFNVKLSSDEEVKELSGTLLFTADNLISSVMLDDYQYQFERSNPNWAEGLEEYGVGYYIKPMDYQAAVVGYFSEEASEEIRKSREVDLSELEKTEGKELVDEIRRWCGKNLDKDSEGLCYQKGNDYWILYYNKSINGLSAWCEPELTEEMELKIRVRYTYSDGAKGVWVLEKITTPIPVEKIIGYDDKTYDILFYDDFSDSSTDENFLKNVRNLYGINGSVVPRWDCRYILHDLITEENKDEDDTDTSLKPEVLGDFKVSDEVKKEIRQIYVKEWKGKDGLMVHKTEDAYWIYYCDKSSNKDADISIEIENNKLIMNCHNDAEYLFDIEPFCWKLFAVKSPVEINQIEITTGDGRQVVSV